MVAFSNTPGDLNIDKLIIARVSCNDLMKQGGPLLFVIGRTNTYHGKTPHESIKVRLNSERTFTVGRNNLIDSVAEDKSPVKYRDLCLRQRVPLAI